MSISEETHEVLVDILTNTESLDKISVGMTSGENSIMITYNDVDEEWFRELTDSLYKDLIGR